MSDQPSPAVQEIVFPNGNHASMVVVPADADAAFVLQALNLPKPQALIVMVGGAAGFDQLQEEAKARLLQLFSRGVARAAASVGAVVIDGGTQVGTMALMGQGVADRGRQSPLIGVAPLSKVTFPGGPADGSIEGGARLDENHSHFVLVQAENWGDESPMIAALAQALGKQVPVVTLVVNGGSIGKTDVLLSVRAKLPIIVVQGSGRLADEIATLWKTKQSAPEKKIPFIPDPVMAEIIADGNISLFSVEDTPEELEHTIDRGLGNPTLYWAWARFALYDFNSVSFQKEFRTLQRWILSLGVVVTALALALTQFQTLLVGPNWSFSFLMWTKSFTLFDALRLPVIGLPILITLLISLSTRFNSGNKYTLLRAAAERVKRELFAYRTHAGSYSDKQLAGASRDAVLQQRVEALGRDLMQTEVKDAALSPYPAGFPLPPKMMGEAAPDDGFSALTPDRYDEVRLTNQITFHRLKVGRFSSELKRLQLTIYFFGALGTFLAAIGLELWIALSTAVVAAITAYLQYTQVEYTMIRNNQTLIQLQNIRAWWRALSVEDKKDQKNIDGLVETTEKLLDDQLAGWVRQMGDALSSLRSQQEKEKAETKS